MATEDLRSTREDVEREAPLTPLAPPSFCCSCFSHREEEAELSAPVGVAWAEPGGLCDECLREDMSMVGDGRLGIGVSMVEGRVMDFGFLCSSLLLVLGPLEASSADEKTVKPRKHTLRQVWWVFPHKLRCYVTAGNNPEDEDDNWSNMADRHSCWLINWDARSNQMVNTPF